MLRRLLLTLVALAASGVAAPVQAADSVVHAVLFYSPSCPHCQVVITEALPPLMDRYGDSLQIVAVDVSAPNGAALYKAAAQRFQLPDDRLGVPALVIGDRVLVGSIEIPELLPALIDAGLAQGGVPWPDIPGLASLLPPEPSWAQAAPAPEPAAAAAAPQPALRDSAGNALAVLVLAGMVGAAVWSAVAWRRPRGGAAPAWRDRAVPLLALLGFGIAGYLTLVETAQAPAVCGPVGDCGAVQESPYATLLGVPIGALGLVGYAGILLAWALTHLLRGRSGKIAGLTFASLAAAGTLFSIYLTWLEPFVIGATCLWCLSSAVLMAALLWLAAPYHGQLAARRTRP